jgi:class 3 adenylate cyclase/tetratricopeptide (TPR) repeat protein
MAVDRKLVAVAMADVVGYSRLMESDESGTHSRLRELRELIVSKAAALRGRLVKIAGDGFLLEFVSATAAVRWAIDVQRELAARNAGVANDTKLELRIGINLGDIIVEGDDIIGDGVNVAARLESLAEPGGICVASAIWEQVREDLGVEFVDAGEQFVKNISKPVHVYRVSVGDGATPGVGHRKLLPAWRMWLRRRRGSIAAGVVALGLVAAGLAMLATRDAPVDDASLSIRVAPFTAPAGDARLGQLADAIGVDLARAMADTMRDAHIVREGDTRYVVEGDVRPSGDEIVVTLRLLDAADRKQLGNERVSMALAEVDSNRERLVSRALLASRDLVDVAEIKRVVALKRPPSTPRELTAKATWLSSQGKVESIHAARKLYDEALRRDSTFVRALTGRAATNLSEFWIDFTADRETLVAALDRDTVAALALEPRDAQAWFLRSSVLMLQGHYEAAFDANDRARAIDPTQFFGQRMLLYVSTGRAQEALKVLEERAALVGGQDAWFRFLRCDVYMHLGRYAEALAECERAAGEQFVLIWLDLAAAYGQTGELEKAAKAKDELLRLVPTFTISRYVAKGISPHPVYLRAVDEHIIPGLRKAGVPE